MRSSFALLVLALIATPALAQTPPGWIADAKTGCRVWNPAPEPGESISWTGGCQNKLAQGRGVLQWFMNGKPGDRYEGEYRDGKENGRGVHTYAGGGRYEGEYRDGKKSGRGVRTLISGARYEGEYRDGKENGQGEFTSKDGSRYVGEVRDGKPNGQGTLKLANGHIYSGTWTKGCFREGSRMANVISTPKECGFQ